MDYRSEHLIHKRERIYFVLSVAVSIGIFIISLVSIVGILYILLFLGLSLLLHALMLGFIRTNGVRLSPEQFPAVYDKVRELCARMEMKFVPDVYVLESGGTLNAFATRFFGRNMVVLYSEIFELIEEGGEEELSFVIAHELAHIKRRHISKQLLLFPAMWIPGVAQAYSRACEFTCDRHAAYYTSNSEAAKNCLTMFGIGKRLSRKVNRTSYLRQANEEKGFVVWLSELLSTHPPLPKRIHEIAVFLEDPESGVIYRSSSNRVWFWLPATTVVLALVIGGAIYGWQRFDAGTFLSEPAMEFNTGSSTPLIESVINGDMTQMNRLLQAGEDVNAQDSNGWTALHWAAKTPDADSVNALLAAGADPNVEDIFGMTPIMSAAADGQLEIVQSLLQAGVNVNYQDYDGWTPLMHAVSGGQTDIVKILLEAGANTEVTDYQDMTALKQSIRQGNQEITALLRNNK